MARKLLSVAVLAAAAAIVFLAAVGPGPASATKAPPVSRPGHLDILYAAPGDLNYAYGPVQGALASSVAADLATANITVAYSGFSSQAQAAFQAAVNIWAATISSPAPIRIQASFTSLGAGVLGSAGATQLCSRTVAGTTSYYPAALADKLNSSAYCASLGGKTAEIQANFNSNFTNWDFGTTGIGVAGRYNFMTVVLHEVGHGLGFFGGFTSNGGVGNHVAPAPFIYDRFAVSGGGVRLLSLARPSAALHAQLTGNNTFVDGSSAVSRNGGLSPKLETHHMTNAYGVTSDNGWRQGSSYSHVDDVLYTGTANGLMTWALNSNEVYTDVGPIVKGMFEDQGWTLSGGAPGVPTLTSPKGTTNATVPDFVWSPVADAHSYELYAAETGSAPLINGTYSASVHCSGATCTVRSPATLVHSRNYEWRVRAITGVGASSWASATFQVLVNPPGQPLLTSPSGTITTMTPEFTWAATSGATTYDLFVTEVGNPTPVVNATYAAVAVCTAGTCTRSSPVGLTRSRDYQWWVRASNEAGNGPWSTASSFRVIDPLAAPTVTAPTGSATPLMPTFSWNAVDRATWYFLSAVPNGSLSETGTWYNASAICSTVACSVAPTTALAPLTAYSVKVRAWNTDGVGPWSSKAVFTTLESALIAPSGGIVTPAPTYSWTMTPEATSYFLWVQRDDSSPSILETYDAAVCVVTTCSVTPRTELIDGAYSWWIQPQFSSSPGTWTPPGRFTVSAVVPGQAAPTWPWPGVSGGLKPAYRWNAVSGATWYLLWVVPATGGDPIVTSWFFGADACSGASCSVTPNVILTSGASYYWWVQTWSSRGTGPWSGGTLFTLPVVTPDAPTLIGPTGSGLPSRPTYSWNRVNAASWYYLWVQPVGGSPVFQQWFQAHDVCSATICTVTPAVGLPGGQSYQFLVQTWNDLGYGPFSAGMTFSR
jgi:hypothetical protein